MTVNQPEQTKATAKAIAAPTFADRVAGWVQDPFVSAGLATVSCALAITTVLTGILLVDILIS